MVDTHVKDASWETDLIWHYFHDVTTEAKPGDLPSITRIRILAPS